MAWGWWTVLIAGWAIFGFWFAQFAPILFTLRYRWLRRQALPLPALPHWPSLSIIVPARDEGKQIEAGLTSLLRLDYPDLEIIAIDDRSTDETGRVMDRLAALDARLRVIHVHELPTGWLGKVHAMQAGADVARGEFLLFTDGDVVFEPDALRLAVLYSEHERLDHLCLFPNMVQNTYWERAVVCYFALLFMAGTKHWLVRSRLKSAYVGIGAFNLVRQRAYAACGGHTPLRLDVLDDVKLGKLLRDAGCRQDALLSGDLVRVPWQPSLWGLVRGLEKNGFAALRYSYSMLFYFSISALPLALAPYVAVSLLPDARSYGYLATLVLLHGVYGALGRCLVGSWLITPAFPIATLILVFAFWRSTWITLRQGGVRWRETFYPLDQLRAHLYQ
jgi:glycosyltransferase involved in cell wall biosynthesis